MFGILSAIVGLGLRGICEVHNYYDNKETMKRTAYKTYNGNIASFGRTGSMYVNGEKVYHKRYTDSNNKEHYMEVGMHSGTIYSDSFEKEAMEDMARNEKEKQRMIEEGYKAYLAYHPNTKLTIQVTTEMSTGKIIAKLIRYSDGRCYKEYANLSECGRTYVESNNVQIPITSREFDELNILSGEHFVSDFGKRSDFESKSTREYKKQMEESRERQILSLCNNSNTLKKLNIDPDKCKYKGHK